MNTAIQIAIESYEKDGVSFTDWFIDNYKLLLQIEKEQIIDAYAQGYSDGVQEPNPNDDYYNETYKI